MSRGILEKYRKWGVIDERKYTKNMW
jgi:hypothetical protein